MSTSAVPNPGSDEALDLGCTCPAMDNGYGDPDRREFGGWVIVEGCPLHDRSDVGEAAFDADNYRDYSFGVPFAEPEYVHDCSVDSVDIRAELGEFPTACCINCDRIGHMKYVFATGALCDDRCDLECRAFVVGGNGNLR